jgi:ESCRT-II complex subunit VPS25
MQTPISARSEPLSAATGDTPSNVQSSTHSTAPNSNNSNTPPFTFPREYSFPPFFTRQTNALTFHAQCHKWSTLILSYCRAHRIWKLSVVDAIDSELFWNRRIERRLNMADAREVLDWMRKEGRAEWVGGPDGGRNVAWIWWRNPEEWAGVIADWVSVRRGAWKERLFVL